MANRQNEQEFSFSDLACAKISDAQKLMSDARELLKQDMDHVKQHKSAFEELTKTLNQVHFGSTVKLNVGGKIYKTTLDTLRKDPDSMLCAMFSGRHELKPDEEDGAYFIDRDAELFRFILNYLRNGELLCSKETLASLKHQLLAEAQFYQLEGLIDKLSPTPKVFTESSIITSREQENTLLSWISDLPSNTKWSLLYKATRDGWKAANFHEKCDGKSPTLVVIKSGDNIFGGYADEPWSSFDEAKWIPCPGSFLFSLKNPAGFAPQKMYSKPTYDEDIVKGGINNDSYIGPEFGPDFGLEFESERDPETDISTIHSDQNPRLGYSCLGHGFQTQHDEKFFVGANEFLMHELEVFGLAK